MNLQQTLLEEFKKHGLSPNEYFHLYHVVTGEDIPKGMNPMVAKARLMEKGWMDVNNNLLEKYTDNPIFEVEKISELGRNIEIYRSYWPKGILPTGKPARSSVKDIEQRFKWFFKNYSYKWDVIFKATESYIVSNADHGYRFMRTAAYFVYKQDSPSIRTSTLADWCETVVSGDVNQTFDINL